MLIDASIYGRQRTPDYMGQALRGYSAGQMMQERRREDDLRRAYASGLVQDDAGNYGYDPQKAVNVLAGKGFGREAMALQMQGQEEQRKDVAANLDAYKKKLDIVSSALGNTFDEPSWEAAKADLEAKGIGAGPIKNMPWSEDNKYRAMNMALSTKEQLEMQMKEREFGLKQQEMQNKYSLENQKLLESQAKRKSEASIKREDLAFKQKQLEKKNEPLSIDQKIAKMGGEQRKRFDNIRMGKMALDDMSKALSRGISTFSLIGDNDYTVAASQWEEAIGRMQSGGAINKEEAARFRKMVPTAVDGRQVQVKKLNKMKQEMERRLSSFGFKPEDIEGFVDKTADRALQRYKRGKIGGMNEAVASEPQVFRTDQIEWAD